MIIPVNCKGKMYLALAIPGITMRSDVKELRNALLDLLDGCLADDDTKDNTPSLSMWLVLRMIVELNKDLEDKERGERS